jgi:chromate transporter
MVENTSALSEDKQARRGFGEIFLVFLRLGLTSFGGPIAHLGYFREEFVVRRRWLTERGYADIVALCQFLPGPASSQVGISVGLMRGGYGGAFAAWLGFTAPSAFIMLAGGIGIAQFPDLFSSGALAGLKVVAVAVVAHAVWGMAVTLCPDRVRITIMTVACVIVVLTPDALSQILVLAGAALFGWRYLKPDDAEQAENLLIAVSRRVSLVSIFFFFLLLGGLPVLSYLAPGQAVAMFDSFYRAGSLVFGGGHVVLPLLQAAVVPSGLLDNDTFLAGYGLAQALPGPLFTFSAFLGAAMSGSPSGVIGGLWCLAAIFAPSFLLVIGILPWWARLRTSQSARSALMGINAAVVGVLLAALYHPVWTSGITSPAAFALAMVAFVALSVWRFPPWLVVAGCGLSGAISF